MQSNTKLKEVRFIYEDGSSKTLRVDADKWEQDLNNLCSMAELYDRNINWDKYKWEVNIVDHRTPQQIAEEAVRQRELDAAANSSYYECTHRGNY